MTAHRAPVGPSKRPLWLQASFTAIDVFLMGSVLCELAGGMIKLILVRAVQGLAPVD